MLYVGVLNTEGLIADEGFLEKLPKEVRERVRSTKNEGEKRLRAGAYALLLELYKECAREHGLTAKMPEICYTGEGKPYFFVNDSLHNVPKFSISHDTALAVVALSFGEESVGVDVQSLPNSRVRLERVAERFLMPLRRLDVQFSRGESKECECEDDIYPTYSFYEIKNGCLVSAPEVNFNKSDISKNDAESDFLAKWTLLEAIIKASGGGFGEASSVGALSDRASTRTVSLSLYKRKYALTVALLR